VSLSEQLASGSEALFETTVARRRHLHANPELSFVEHETVAYVRAELEKMGLTRFETKANTGLVAYIEGSEPSANVLALRADMDALPIVEANEVDYASKNSGVMHACGHDVHTSSLLSTTKLLWDARDSLKGTIKLIFQPGEEKLPGGASMMIKDGVLENPKPRAIIGQHVMPLLPAGTVGFREGRYMASADEIYLTVKGKGGHGAMPEMGIDPVVITAQIITALQTVVSRNNSPKLPSVLSFGKVTAEGATNVLPNEVKLEGTFRTYDETWRFEAHKRVTEISKGIAQGMGGDCDVDIVVGYPALHNSPELTRRLRKAAEQYMGTENVLDLDLWLAAEDFAFYSQQLDSCFYRLGIRNEAKGITSGLHTPTFDIDEEALRLGPGLMAYLAIEELAQGPKEDLWRS